MFPPDAPFFLEQGIFRSFFLARRRKFRIVRSPPRRAGCPHPAVGWIIASLLQTGVGGLSSWRLNLLQVIRVAFFLFPAVKRKPAGKKKTR